MYWGNAYQLTIQEFSLWRDQAVRLFPEIIVSTVILLIFLFIAKLSGRLLEKLFLKAFQSKTSAHLSAFFAKSLIISIGLFFALGILSLDTTVVSLLAGAGAIGVLLGLAFQNIIINIASGLVLGLRKPFRTNDLIVVGDVLGYVKRLRLRDITLETRSGQYVTIPNKNLIQNVITNYNTKGMMRVKINTHVYLDEDLDRVEQVVKDAFSHQNYVLKWKPIDAYALEFTETSVRISVRYWVEFPNSKIKFREFQHLGIKTISKAFRENDIKIPYPVRSLDFNMSGGKKFEVLQ